jgi:beta-glucosidase
MKAGNDLLMPGTPQQNKKILDAVNSGALDVKVLDENAARLVAYVLGTPSFKKYAFSNKPDLKVHAAIARNAAANGMILLKNETAALPIAKNAKSIAVFGNTSYDFISGGTGSGDVNEEYTISLVAGLSNAGYKVDSDLKSSYEKYLGDYKAAHPKKGFFEEFMNPTPRPAELDIDAATISKRAAESDIALITIGRNAGEGSDRKVANDFDLTVAEQELIKSIAAAFHAVHKKVVVVLNVGGVIEVASWRNEVDAILLSWQPGMEAGNAVADVLSGKVNPSGKLTSTFPAKYSDDPTAKNFPGKEFPEQAEAGMFGMKQIPAEVAYEEGVYVGYRYYNTFKVATAYEFGYGLSYTNFNYSNLLLSAPSFNGKITASVTITNTGKVAGKEVVQLYISAPAQKLAKPAEELKAFAKTALLQPGKSETIQFELNANDLASFDTNSTSWIAEAGKYIVKVAASSENIKKTASFNLPKELIAEKCNKVLTPKVEINELKQ